MRFKSFGIAAGFLLAGLAFFGLSGSEAWAASGACNWNCAGSPPNGEWVLYETCQGSVNNCRAACPPCYRDEGECANDCEGGCVVTGNNCSTTACGSLCFDNCGGVNLGTACSAGSICRNGRCEAAGGGGGGGGSCEGCACGEGGNRTSCVPNPICGGVMACCDPRCGGGGGGGGDPNQECINHPEWGAPPQGCCRLTCRASRECRWNETWGEVCDDPGWICHGNANSGIWSACSGSPATKTRVNDCGATQTTACTGSIRARAMIVSRTDTSCSAVRNSTAPLIGTIHRFGPSSASQPNIQLQTGSSYVVFLSIPGGNYNLTPQIPPNTGYVISRACWSRDLNAPLSGEGLFATLSVPREGEVLTWDVGYSLPYPWWQVKDADVTANGQLTSLIPATCILPACNPQFELDGDGGYPGVPSYITQYDFSHDAGTGIVSSKGWIANSQTRLKKTYNYAFFESQMPAEVKSSMQEITSPRISSSSLASGGNSARGYVWYHFDGNQFGDLTLEGDLAIPGSRKIILLVEGGNLYINGKINIADRGQGFFMAVVGKTPNGSKGNVFVDPSAVAHPTLPSLEGIFLAEGRFETGSLGQVLDARLIVRGSIAAYEGIGLQRDLVNNSSGPAEFFEYAPELMLLFPDAFTARKMRWKEEAP